MNKTPSAERYLELFDKLDLQNIEDRRVGVHLLRNYFSTVLTRLATEQMNSKPSFGTYDLDKQWREVMGKFESIPGQFPKELEGLPFQILKTRNPVSHNDRYDPRQDIDGLQRVREQAPEWKKETKQMADAYFHAWEGLSPKEALVELAERNLRKVFLAEPQFERYETDYSNVKQRAKEAEETLEEEVDTNRERIEKELVQIVELSQNLTVYIDSLEETEMEYADYLANDVRDQIQGR